MRRAGRRTPEKKNRPQLKSASVAPVAAQPGMTVNAVDCRVTLALNSTKLRLLSLRHHKANQDLVKLDFIRIRNAKLAFVNELLGTSAKNNITLSSKSIMDFFPPNNSVSLMKLHEISPRHHVVFPALQPKSPP